MGVRRFCKHRPVLAICLVIAGAHLHAQSPAPSDQTGRAPRLYVNGTLTPVLEGGAGLVWRHRVRRDNAYWFMNGSTMVASSRFSPGDAIASDPAWELRAVADMNGDRNDDVLWQHAASGEMRVSLLVGGTRIATRSILALDGTTAEPDVDWKIVGAADMNLDGYADLLWRDRQSGAIRLWHMRQTTQLDAASLSHSPVDLRWDVAGLSDLNGDGTTDIVWRDGAGDRTAVWLMNGATLVGSTRMSTASPGAGWRLAAVGDVNRDGHADFAWQHETSGELALWYLNRLSVVVSVPITPSVTSDPDWVLAGVALTLSNAPSGASDFSGDGSPDVVWRNPGTGRNALWTMNRDAILNTEAFSPGADLVIDLGWHIRAIGDMNGDGQGDVIWQHAPTGQIGAWMFAGATRIGAALFETLSGASVEPDPDWIIAGAADMNRDGSTDIVWRHRTAGSLRIWHMNGIEQLDSLDLSTGVVDPLWEVGGLADMNRDGWIDLVWRHTGDGRLAVWLMNDTELRDTPSLTPAVVADPNWFLAGVADINRDGHPDLVWQHLTQGRLAVWYMNGLAAVEYGPLGPGTIRDPGWRIVGVR